MRSVCVWMLSPFLLISLVVVGVEGATDNPEDWAAALGETVPKLVADAKLWEPAKAPYTVSFAIQFGLIRRERRVSFFLFSSSLSYLKPPGHVLAAARRHRRCPC